MHRFNIKSKKSILVLLVILGISCVALFLVCIAYVFSQNTNEVPLWICRLFYNVDNFWNNSTEGGNFVIIIIFPGILGLVTILNKTGIISITGSALKIDKKHIILCLAIVLVLIFETVVCRSGYDYLQTSGKMPVELNNEESEVVEITTEHTTETKVENTTVTETAFDEPIIQTNNSELMNLNFDIMDPLFFKYCEVINNISDEETSALKLFCDAVNNYLQSKLFLHDKEDINQYSEYIDLALMAESNGDYLLAATNREHANNFKINGENLRLIALRYKDQADIEFATGNYENSKNYYIETITFELYYVQYIHTELLYNCSEEDYSYEIDKAFEIINSSLDEIEKIFLYTDDVNLHENMKNIKEIYDSVYTEIIEFVI